MKYKLDLAVYKEIMRYEKASISIWDLKTDTIIYDSLQEEILGCDALKAENYSFIVLNLANIHPNDRKLIYEYVAFLG